MASQGTLCEGAELRIRVVPARGQCVECQAVCEVSDLMAHCPACGAWPLSVDGGREMSLSSLEVS
jgi:hydrogenase nickel incorporation protein HypA/HybF